MISVTVVSLGAILCFGTLKRGDAKTRVKNRGLEPNHRLARTNSWFGSSQIERGLLAHLQFHYEKVVLSLRVSLSFITSDSESERVGLERIGIGDSSKNRRIAKYPYRYPTISPNGFQIVEILFSIW